LGGLPHLIRSDVDGLLVPPGDVASLRAAIVRLLSDDDRRRQLADNARQRALSFTAAAVVPRIEAAYTAVVEARAVA